MNAETFLKGYLKAQEELELLSDQKKHIEQEMMPRSMEITGMPSAHNQNDKMAECMARLEEICIQIDKAVRKAVEQMDLIYATIDKVEDVKLRKVLYFRYIKGCTWSDIEDAIGYTDRHARRLKNIALEEVSKYIDDCK